MIATMAKYFMELDQNEESQLLVLNNGNDDHDTDSSGIKNKKKLAIEEKLDALIYGYFSQYEFYLGYKYELPFDLAQLIGIYYGPKPLMIGILMSALLHDKIESYQLYHYAATVIHRNDLGKAYHFYNYEKNEDLKYKYFLDLIDRFGTQANNDQCSADLLREIYVFCINYCYKYKMYVIVWIFC